MSDKKALTVRPSGDLISRQTPAASLPALPYSSGAVGTRRRIMRKDTEYVEQHAAYLQARSNQSNAMRDLVESRVRLAVSLTKLSAIPEICAAEYWKGRRERARDLLVTDLQCQEEELRAKAAVAAAHQALEAYDPPPPPPPSPPPPAPSAPQVPAALGRPYPRGGR